MALSVELKHDAWRLVDAADVKGASQLHDTYTNPDIAVRTHSVDPANSYVALLLGHQVGLYIPTDGVTKLRYEGLGFVVEYDPKSRMLSFPVVPLPMAFDAVIGGLRPLEETLTTGGDPDITVVYADFNGVNVQRASLMILVHAGKLPRRMLEW